MSVRTLSLLVIGLLAGGCTASPEKVCNHMKELVQTEKPEDGDTVVDNCIRNAQKAKDKNPDTWSECSKCSMNAATLKDFNHCFDACSRR